MIRRVLLVSEPGRDGVFGCVRRLADFLHEHHPEITVDLAYSSCRGSTELTALVERVRLRGGEAVDMRVNHSPQPADVIAWIRLLRLIWTRKPKLIHAHSSKAGALVRLIAWLPGFPAVVYSPHAYFGMPEQGGLKEQIFNQIERFLGRWSWSLFCSEDERDFAIRKLGIRPDRSELIHNGINLQRFSPAADATRIRLRQALGIPPDGRLLVTTGRESFQKNYAPLYAALNRVLREPEWFFVHAGAGSVELRAKLSPEAQSRSLAFEHLDDPSQLLRAADAFVLTSRYEGLSLSMLEALSCGLAMILTRAPGFRTIASLSFPEVRWLQNPAQAEEIVQTLRDWSPLSAEARATQRELAVRYFDDTAQLEAIVQLYNRLI